MALCVYEVYASLMLCWDVHFPPHGLEYWLQGISLLPRYSSLELTAVGIGLRYRVEVYLSRHCLKKGCGLRERGIYLSARRRRSWSGWGETYRSGKPSFAAEFEPAQMTTRCCGA